ITYVLMAITCISVVVALFMIALLMYTIVQDRTQEIGILRSIGARKLDIMRIFNVESLLLGLFASIVGTVFALIIAYPLNMLLKSVLAISNLISVAWWHSLTLVACSIVLTLISGLIPAIIAANKDPVVALKSE
ncbi:MAG: FtsX-like permease family protein, partial [Eubacteriales bacterium]|nr:FtsX-like permease family protein [Eubacteriales bacterium]